MQWSAIFDPGLACGTRAGKDVLGNVTFEMHMVG